MLRPRLSSGGLEGSRNFAVFTGGPVAARAFRWLTMENKKKIKGGKDGRRVRTRARARPQPVGVYGIPPSLTTQTFSPVRPGFLFGVGSYTLLVADMNAGGRSRCSRYIRST